MEVDLSILDSLYSKEAPEEKSQEVEPVKKYVKFEKEKELLEQSRQVYKEYQKNIIASEQLRAKINKATRAGEPLENILLMALECIGIMSQDKLFLQTNKANLEKIPRKEQ